MNNNVYKPLGTFRLFLALCVLTSHSGMFLPKAIHGLYLGNIGVLMFFIVSGFVISEACDIFYRGNYRGYITNRFLKIYPAYWIVTLICFITYSNLDMTLVPDIPKVNTTIESIFVNITLLTAYLKYFNNLVLLTQTWAVIVEFQFYFIIGVIIIYFKNNKNFLILFSIISLALYLCISIYKLENRFFGSYQFSPYFFFGSYLYYYLFRNIKNLKYPLLVSLICVIHHYFSYNSRGSTEDVLIYGKLFGLPLSVMLSTVLFLILIYFFYKIVKLNINKFFVSIDKYFGSITYSIYLVHMPVIVVVKNFQIESNIVSFVLIALISVIASIFIQYISEVPIDNIRNKLRGCKLYD